MVENGKLIARVPILHDAPLTMSSAIVATLLVRARPIPQLLTARWHVTTTKRSTAVVRQG